MENRSDTSNNKHRKLFWGSITLEEIKQAISFKKSPQIINHSSSVSCGALTRCSNYGQSNILNCWIRQHFFGNFHKHLNIINKFKLNKNKSLDNAKKEKESTVNYCEDDVSTNDLNEQSVGVLNEKDIDLTSCEENEILENDVEQNNNEIENNLCNIIDVDGDKYNEKENKSLLIKDEENSRSLTDINFHQNINNSTMRLEKSMIDSKKCLDDTLDEINIILNEDNNNISPLRQTRDNLESTDSKRKFLSNKCEKNIASLSDIVKKKSLFKQPSKILHKTSKFKNVVSPVAMYIKNPSTVPPVQHVPNCEINENLFANNADKPRSTQFNNKENINLPFRVYRPAKTTIVAQETNIKLPQNIQKQITLTPQIIKHSRRIRKENLSDTVIEAQLLQGDLTERFNQSLNLSRSVQDISLLIAKETYIK